MRTTIVSTSKLKTTKVLGIGLIIAFICLVTLPAMYTGQSFTGIFYLAFWGYFAYKAISMILKLKNISYDDSSVYYEKKGFEVQIPFEEIRDIEIKTVTGIYNINLYRPSQDGKKVPFKMSLWYPLNFKAQDEKVDVLRDKIDRHKRTLPERNYEELPGYRI